MIDVPFAAKPMSGRKLHEYRLSLIGIRDPEIVEELWVAAQVKAAAEAKSPKKRRGRR